MAISRRDEAIAENKSRDLARDDAIAENSARNQSKLIKNILIFIVLAAIAAIGYIYFVPAAYKLIAAAAAVVLVLVWFGSSRQKRTFNIILIAAIAALIIVFFPVLKVWAATGYGYASNSFTQAKTGGIGGGLNCMLHPTDAKCFGEGLWKETKTSQDFKSFSIDVDWGDKMRTVPLYKTVGLKIKTSMPLKVTPQCYLGSNPIKTTTPFGTDLNFAASDSIQSSSVTCSDETSTSTKLALKISAQNIEQTIKAGIWIGKGESKGKLSAKNDSGPYSISLENPYDTQPFGVGSYPINIVIKSSIEEINITQINSLKLISTSNRASIECNFGNELKASKADVGKWLAEKGISCQLIINDVPSQGSEQIFIESKFNYDIEKTFRTNLNTA
jgi:hypothetical protein